MSDQEKKEQEKKVVRANISADEDTRKGVYSNQAVVSHTAEEFLLDFCLFSPTHPTQGQLVSRVLLNPGHAKRFAAALQDNINRYEAQFGEIRSRSPIIQGEPTIVQ